MIIKNLIQDRSDSKNLDSERQLIREVSSYTPSILTIAHLNDSLFFNLDYPKSQIGTLRKTRGPPDSQPTDSLFGLAVLTSAEMDLYLYNLQHHEEEPEDEILAESGVLSQLLAQAMREPPSDNWERHLDEL